jgi:hypothetical protein
VSSYQIITATSTGALPAGQFKNATAVCPAGTHVLGGGGVVQAPLASSLTLVSSYPASDQIWFAEFRNNSSFSYATVTIAVYAVCAIAN